MIAKRSKWIYSLIVGVGLVIGLLQAKTFSKSGQNTERVIHITARRFSYTPAHIVLRKGVPVILELSSSDRLHGFNIPALGLRADIVPGQTVRIRVMPDKVGRFPFHCDNYCGTGHENMSGVIVVSKTVDPGDGRQSGAPDL